MNRFASFLAILAACSACNSKASPRGPEATCASACEAHDPKCSQEECWRGCNLVLDRLAEHEGDKVLACVARAATTCDDRLWARCAVRIGVHADGGPPAPPKPSDIEDLDED